MGKQVSDETFQKARKWCAQQFKKRRDIYTHASFTAVKILEEANRKFDLGGFGVEGWCSTTGHSGVDYINMGDPYTATLVCRSVGRSASFHYAAGGWGPYA